MEQRLPRTMASSPSSKSPIDRRCFISPSLDIDIADSLALEAKLGQLLIVVIQSHHIRLSVWTAIKRRDCGVQAHDSHNVQSVRSDERASKLWPDPQEPEYYL